MTRVQKNKTQKPNSCIVCFQCNPYMYLCNNILCLFTGYGYHGPFLEWWGGYHKPEDIQIWINELLLPVFDLKPSMLITLHILV